MYPAWLEVIPCIRNRYSDFLDRKSVWGDIRFPRSSFSVALITLFKSIFRLYFGSRKGRGFNALFVSLLRLQIISLGWWLFHRISRLMMIKFALLWKHHLANVLSESRKVRMGFSLQFGVSSPLMGTNVCWASSKTLPSSQFLRKVHRSSGWPCSPWTIYKFETIQQIWSKS